VNAAKVVALAVPLLLGAARTAAAQQPAGPPSYERVVPAGLLAQVKVGEDSARVLALARVPGGTVESVELLRDQGRLTWVWDIKVAGKRGITEVSVNAMDATVVAHEE